MKTNKIQQFILKLIGLPPLIYDAMDMQLHGDKCRTAGAADAKAKTRHEFGVLPLPLTENQLRGGEYGTFVTVDGFPEQSIAAPGPSGYEHYALYTSKAGLDHAAANGLICTPAHHFQNPADSEALVPCIVTLLR